MIEAKEAIAALASEDRPLHARINKKKYGSACLFGLDHYIYFESLHFHEHESKSIHSWPFLIMPIFWAIRECSDTIFCKLRFRQFPSICNNVVFIPQNEKENEH